MQPRYEQPVADYVRFHAEHNPDVIAYQEDGETCTYPELNRRASQVANGLAAHGCTPGDRIGFLGVNSGGYVEVFYGAAKARVLYTGLNWRLAPAELAFLLEDSGCRVIFCDPEFETMLNDLAKKIPTLELVLPVDERFSTWRDSQSDSDPFLTHEAEEPIVQFYTSGTTGRPKGVLLTNRNMSTLREAEDNYGEWYVSSDRRETLINAMPNFHVGGLGWMLIGMFRGARVLLLPAMDADIFLDLVESEQANHFCAVPVVIQMMVEAQRARPRDLSSLRLISYGAASIAPAVLRDAMETLSDNFVQFYGMTEMNGSCTVLRPEDHSLENPERLLSCGRAAPLLEIEIRDAAGKPVPPGQHGELWLRGGTMMAGYWNRPEATAEAIVDGWYRSGDGGHMDEEGYIFISDRIKDMVVTGGENVYPNEVENALYEHDEIVEAAVVGIPDEKWGEALLGFIVRAKGSKLTDDDLIAFLRERIAGYKIPRRYRFVDAFPRTPSGKIKKFELRDKAASSEG